ncbi:hypothetical protein [Nocardia sp. CS682]|uniref:hypothetical protein n=1 Tax=Nocardia sp. CS682 TaxID=1047172 RepID=UPI001074F50C|nr:hypothetical protein [Nocardia sp. CS682]QBS40847.1 hypothetical protein DMB37_12695 [Nocardia sp. CS682]
MRTSKVLVGSVVAIAAALQIGMVATASSAADESISVAAVALDSSKKNLLVDVVFTCAEGAKHSMISVAVKEEAKEGDTPAEGTGTADVDLTEKDPDTGEDVVAEKGCDGSEQRRTVTVEPDEGMKWSQPGKGTVTVSFSDDVQFNTQHSGVQWIGEV